MLQRVKKFFTGRNDITMTEGPIFRVMLRFVLPLIVTNLLQMLYTAADSMIVGMSSEPDGVGAIGTTMPMINLIVNIFVGCAVGCKVAVAQSLGAGNRKQTEDTVHSAVALSLVLGLACCLVGVSICRPVLAAMGNEGKLLLLADRYAKIYFLGVPFVAVTNFCIAMIQASGDTQTPLYVLTFSGLFNVVISWFFVVVCGLSVEGAAAGTSLSQLLSAVLLLARLAKGKGPCRLVFRKVRLKWQPTRRMLHIGVPAGVQSALFSLSHMVIQSSILQVEHAIVPQGSAWQPVVKGNAAATSIESFGYTTINATAQAAITFTGQNASAGHYDRVKKVRRLSYCLAFGLGVVFALIMLTVLRDPMLSLYGVKKGSEDLLEQIAYKTALTRMLFMFIPYFLLGFMEVGSGILQGLGRSFTSTAISLTGSVAFRILWIMIAFRAFPCLEVVFLSYPLSWFLTAAAHYTALRVITRKKVLTAKAKKIAEAKI